MCRTWARKQNELLRRLLRIDVIQNAKSDLANCFVERCLRFLRKDARFRALVTPQNWFFQTGYMDFAKYGKNAIWNFVAKLGRQGAFEYNSGARSSTYTSCHLGKAPEPGSNRIVTV